VADALTRLRAATAVWRIREFLCRIFATALDLISSVDAVEQTEEDTTEEAPAEDVGGDEDVVRELRRCGVGRLGARALCVTRPAGIGRWVWGELPRRWRASWICRRDNGADGPAIL